MSKPTVTMNELSAIEALFEMQDGYVLGFTDYTFALFFADFGIDIDKEFPDGSKAKRLRAFLREAEPLVVANVLEGLLERMFERFGPDGDDDSSLKIQKVRNLIARLRGAYVCLPEISASVDVLNLSYIHELEAKTNQRLAASDLDGAITSARTMLEAVLAELERHLIETPEDHQGDLQRQYKLVAKKLQMDSNRADLDDSFKQVMRGLVQIVNGLAPIRNKMSDGHPRTSKPAFHHARFIANASTTVATFLVESYIYQRDNGLLPTSSPVPKREP